MRGKRRRLPSGFWLGRPVIVSSAPVGGALEERQGWIPSRWAGSSKESQLECTTFDSFGF